MRVFKLASPITFGTASTSSKHKMYYTDEFDGDFSDSVSILEALRAENKEPSPPYTKESPPKATFGQLIKTWLTE